MDNKDSSEYEKLVYLIKKFAINVYLVQKYDLQTKNTKEKNQLIEEYEKSLTKEELEFLNHDINNRIQLLNNSFNETNIKTRFYILKNNEYVIGFQTAQIRKSNEIFEGWRNFAYNLPEYAGIVDEVIDENSKIHKTILSNALYERITNWFLSENIELERTATGKNMYKNILVYMLNKNFEIDRIDDQRIYFIKKYSCLKSQNELKQDYENYIKRR